MAEARIRWPAERGVPLSVSVTLRITSSATRDKPKREPQFVICRKATAFTPRLMPTMPSRAKMSRATAQVERVGPAALCRVTSTVFMNVQKPMVA
jgi:hypothetical protein